LIDAATSSATGNAPAISRSWYLSLVLLGSAIFFCYSGAFLYFFVDDEAIPLVYAVNLARGHGLIYTALEGRLEGYSDFLHVLWSWALFEATSIAHGQRLTVLLVGKGVSLLAGLGIIIVCARTMRSCEVGKTGMAAGLVFLALAGPLAVWSCSSLETVPFSLMLAGLWSIGLVDLGKARWAPVVAVALAAVAILERIDGILYVLVILGAVTPLRGDRRIHFTVLAGIGAIAVAYHAWRFAYFGSWFSAPLLAKVLYHLEPPRHAMVKEPALPYFVAFVRVYGLAAAIGLAGAAAAAWRVPAARRTMAAVVVLAAYVAVVGDWMFGWRFTVPLLPLVAFVIGCAVTQAPSPWAWALTAVVGFLSASEARAFLREYVAEERRPIFWAAPGAGLGAWLAPYYDLVNTARPLIKPGERIAYNQAGLLPYLLDAENIDDLGICSKFVAGLPTTDIYYTQVGRFSPPEDGPVLSTAHAYLLYQDVQFLISRTDLLLKANWGAVPDQLLGGYFRRIAMDRSGENAIYGRTGKPADDYRKNPDLFTENVAHISHIRRAAIGAETLLDDELESRLPFLRGQRLHMTVNPNADLTFTFAPHDADVKVSAVYIGRLAAREPLLSELELLDKRAQVRKRITVNVNRFETPIWEQFPPLDASTLAIHLRGRLATRVTIGDVRVEGQTEELRAYLRRALTFPHPGLC
jgi:hypothetical protein